MSDRRRATAFSPRVRVVLLLGLGVAALADEPAVTVVADFEDASVAAQIIEVRNGPRGDCRAARVQVPARGQGALALTIGATARKTEVVCDLTLREPIRVPQADRVGTYCWIDDGEFGLVFRVRDAREQLFETTPQTVKLPNRWVYAAADVRPDQLRQVRGATKLTFPIEVIGYRVSTDRLGQQVVHLDDLQIEHRVPVQDLVRGAFEFDETTRIYEPGSAIAAAVVLENLSRQKPVSVSVDLAWTRSDASVLQTQTADVSLPASGADLRSSRKLDFSQKIEVPGLYRLVVRARVASAASPKVFETSIAVAASNRRVSRGRGTFFAVRTNLLQEPELDQQLEIRVARDIGVNLLAVETPWRAVEPKPGSFDFRVLEPVIDALTRKGIDMAAMAVLTEPPEWAATAPDVRRGQLVALVNALAGRFGERLTRVHLAADILGEGDLRGQFETVRAVRARIIQSQPKIELLPPAVAIDAGGSPAELGALVRENPDLPFVFATRGDSAQALAALEQFRAAGAFDWRPAHWWVHVAEPIVGAGSDADAVAVLRHFMRAAACGISGVMWSDLRDDGDDPRHAAEQHGLLRRDFSPRTTLLGYATASGLFTGYRCAGPVAGAPREFESALFIGGKQQIAALLPRPGAILPAAVAPVNASPGEFSVRDFERRAQKLLTPNARPLVATLPRPLFIELALKQAQSEPRLSLARPWLRVPACALSGAEATFAFELDAPRVLARSYWELRLPKNAPVECVPASGTLRGDGGSTIRVEAKLKPTGAADFDAVAGILRIVLGEDTVELPVTVRPLTAIRPLASAARISDASLRLAALAPAESQRVKAKATLQGGYEREALHIAVTVEDESIVPPDGVRSGTISGDNLLIGLAAEGVPEHMEVRVAVAAEPPRIEAVFGTAPDRVAGWRCLPERGSAPGSRTYHLIIPARALGCQELAAGDRLRLAAQYMNDDGDGQAPGTLAWGNGLGGSRSTAQYRWVALVGSTGH